MDEYEKQANEFLEKTGTGFEVEFIGHKKHFVDDSNSRDVYKITLKRGSREYSFDFGQSINCSGEYIVKGWLDEEINPNKKYALTAEEYKKLRSIHLSFLTDITEKNKNYSKPTAYDVLACLIKHDPGTFEEFCQDYGYSEDSRKAEKSYKSVTVQFNNLKMLYNDEELKQMQEIE